MNLLDLGHVKYIKSSHALKAEKWAGREVGRREEGSGDSEQDVVGSAGMLVEPTRLKQHVICGTI